MNRYRYDGPVLVFDTCVMDRFEAETTAASEAKARSNLAYQFKRRNNRAPYSKVSLPGKISLVE